MRHDCGGKEVSVPLEDSDGQQNVIQPSSTLQKYAHYMSEEDQTIYTKHVIDDLRKRLSYAKSKSYGYIVDDIKGMYTCCEASKKLILDFVEEVEYNYGNRPALMRLLRN